jgi:hypothetical protein
MTCHYLRNVLTINNTVLQTHTMYLKCSVVNSLASDFSTIARCQPVVVVSVRGIWVFQLLS